MIEMKTIQAIFMIGFLLAGCSAPSESGHQAAAFLPGPLPDKWTATCSTDSDAFKPLRGLTNAVAQITLVNTSETLTQELTPERTRTFYPNLVLLVFDKSELRLVEQVVEKEAFRSDYPPIVFGQTDKHVFVTSPGYVNQGLYTPEAIAITKKLKSSLKELMEIR